MPSLLPWKWCFNVTSLLVDSAILPNGDLWVTGGRNKSSSRVSSTDIIEQDFHIKRGPDLPDRIYSHCIANWNSTHMLLTGGSDGLIR